MLSHDHEPVVYTASPKGPQSPLRLPAAGAQPEQHQCQPASHGLLHRRPKHCSACQCQTNSTKGHGALSKTLNDARTRHLRTCSRPVGSLVFQLANDIDSDRVGDSRLLQVKVATCNCKLQTHAAPHSGWWTSITCFYIIHNAALQS